MNKRTKVLWLTQLERDKFVAWLQQEIDANKGLIEQMEQIDSPAVMVNRLKTEAAACAVIGRMLSSIEEMSISGGE